MKKMIFFILFSYPAIAMETSNIHQALAQYKNDDPSKHPLYNSLYVDDRTEKWWLEEEKPKIIKAIEQNGIVVINKPQHGTTGYTPLCRAIEGHDFGFVKFLLKNGADINQKINNVHSSRPIFFAKTLEMVQFLQNNGADINGKNEGIFFSNGMNFLHWAMHADTHDDRIMHYALTQKFDPQSLSEDGGNLWHNLMYPLSPSSYSHETLMARAQLLNKLGIDPYAKNNEGKSAVDKITDDIKDILESVAQKSVVQSHLFSWEDQNNKIKHLLKILTYVLESTTKTIK